MLIRNKRKVIVSLCSINIGIVFLTLVIGCVAWFSVTDVFKPFSIDASVITSYFDSRSNTLAADGTEENPFVITRPIHYYNLVNLIQSDTTYSLNGTEVRFNSAGFHFEFGKDLDGDGDKEFYEYDSNGIIREGRTSNYLNLEYYRGSNALMPIGTAAKPFFGHIVGNNLTVQNIHISGQGLCDIGIFGYITINSTVSSLYFDGVDIDVKQPGSELEDVTHTVDHEQINVGYLAGHVPSESLFSNVYVNNCRIRNSSSSTGHQRNDYGFFGFSDTNSTPIQSGESFEYEINADAVNSYFSDHYSSIQGTNLITRNTDPSFNAGTKFSDAVDSSGSTYTLTGTQNGTSSSASDYPLGSIGYQEADQLINVWYKENQRYESIPGGSATPEIVDEEPGDRPGRFLYHDGERWKYYYCVAGQTVETNMQGWYYPVFFSLENPNIQSEPIANRYTYNKKVTVMPSNSYQVRDMNWWRWGVETSGGVTKLTYSKGGSKDNAATFMFLEAPGVFHNPDDLYNSQYRQDHMISTNDMRSCYIFYPANGSSDVRYVYVARSGPNKNRLLIGNYQDASDPEKSLACKFDICKGLGGVYSFKANVTENGQQKTKRYVLAVSGSGDNRYIEAKPYTSGMQIAYMGTDPGDMAQIGSKPAYAWRLVENNSELNNGDHIAITYTSNLNNVPLEVMSAKKSGNVRNSVGSIVDYKLKASTKGWEGAQQYDGNKYMLFSEQEHAELTLEKSGGYYALKDSKNHGYLYGGSTRGDYLRLLDEDNLSGAEEAKWSISINSNTKAATITCNGPQGASNNLKFDVDNLRFTCFQSNVSGTVAQNVYIFKRISTSGNISFMNEVPVYSIGNNTNNWGRYTGPVTSYTYDVYSTTTGSSDYSLLRTSPDEIDSESWDFDYTGNSDSTSVITVMSAPESGWFRARDLTDLKVGDQYVFAVSTRETVGLAGSPIENGKMALASHGLTFSDNRRVIETLPMNAIIFRLGGSRESGYTFRAESGSFLGTTGIGFVNISATGEFRWNVDFTGSGNAVVDSFDAEAGGFKFNINSNYFTTANVGQDIMLYHNTTQEKDETFVADVITQEYDPLYNPDMIDVFGGVEITENSFTLDGGYDIKSPLWHDRNSGNGIGDKFFRTRHLNDCVAVFVPNLGSLDLGTIRITGYGSIPEFIKGKDLDNDNKSVPLDSRIISGDNEAGGGQFDYSISLNIYNIFAASYCALDQNGNIIAGFDATGEQNIPSQIVDFEDIKTFVIVIGGPTSGFTNVSKVNYKFSAINGNMSNFGQVGYRTATYIGGSADNHGNEVTESSIVSGPILSFSYETSQLKPNTMVYVSVTYIFDATENRYIYNIDFYCSENIQVYIFNFDAQREYVRVNGTRLKGSYNVVNITATPPPDGGWTQGANY